MSGKFSKNDLFGIVKARKLKYIIKLDSHLPKHSKDMMQFKCNKHLGVAFGGLLTQQVNK